MKSPLRYPGGKTRATNLLLELIPTTNTLYSPFFGGGSLEFAWAEANPQGQIIARDNFSQLVCFWEEVFKGNHVAIADRSEQFLQISKPTFKKLQHLLILGEGSKLEIATWFFIVNRASFSGATLSGGMAEGERFTQTACDRLRHITLPNIQFQQANVFNSIRRRTKRFDNGVIFLDPPYALKNSKLYGVKGSTHHGFNHERLAGILKKLNAQGTKWIMTYNDDPYIKHLYNGMSFIHEQWSYGMSANKIGDELIILSDALSESLGVKYAA